MLPTSPSALRFNQETRSRKNMGVADVSTTPRGWPAKHGGLGGVGMAGGIDNTVPISLFPAVRDFLADCCHIASPVKKVSCRYPATDGATLEVRAGCEAGGSTWCAYPTSGARARCQSHLSDARYF